jgi:hypothetical protein
MHLEQLIDRGDPASQQETRAIEGQRHPGASRAPKSLSSIRYRYFGE